MDTASEKSDEKSDGAEYYRYQARETKSRINFENEKRRRQREAIVSFIETWGRRLQDELDAFWKILKEEELLPPSPKFYMTFLILKEHSAEASPRVVIFKKKGVTGTEGLCVTAKVISPFIHDPTFFLEIDSKKPMLLDSLNDKFVDAYAEMVLKEEHWKKLFDHLRTLCRIAVTKLAKEKAEQPEAE